MFWPKYNITDGMNSALLEIERARGFLEAADLREEWLDELRIEALVREAHFSTHIEGTTLTLDQSDGILRGEIIANVARDDRQELLNYREAMDYVSRQIGSQSEITEENIKEIHAILVKDVRGGSLEPGNYREVQNYIVDAITGKAIYTPPSASEVPGQMAEFVEWLNKRTGVSAVLTAGIAQFQFVQIHPFLDGNGRTARLLCTLILYKNDYDFQRLFSLSEFYDEERQQYYNAIQGVRDMGLDLTGWLEYFTKGLQSQLMGIKVMGELAIKEDAVMDRARKFLLNERQLMILQHIVDNGQASVEETCDRFDLVRRTVQRDLARMVELGLVEEVAQSKTDPTKHYRLA
jgi:Fic family protein